MVVGWFDLGNWEFWFLIGVDFRVVCGVGKRWMFGILG